MTVLGYASVGIIGIGVLFAGACIAYFTLLSNESVSNGQWSTWTACDRTCGTALASRVKVCPPSTVCTTSDIGQEQLKDCDAVNDPCPINGVWNPWLPWAACPVTCGGASVERLRSCIEPQYKGKDCPGPKEQSQKCNERDCPKHGNWNLWTEWTDCDEPCGGGSRFRTRECDAPAPENGGNFCVGFKLVTAYCNSDFCPVDGLWSNWTPWTSCSQTCEGGYETRKRVCDSPIPQHGGKICDNDDEEVRTCDLGECPIDGNWSEWTIWAPCSESCGGGKTKHTRTCTDPVTQFGGLFCPGSDSEEIDCQTQPCPIGGMWSVWSIWTACVQTCGASTRTKARTCSDPTPQHGGPECIGEDYINENCNDLPCPINGAWGNWQAWQQCDKPCETGTQIRNRECESPEPRFGGTVCNVADKTSSQECNKHDCPIDGVWADWSDWSVCSLTCGTGKASRTRVCSNPAPQFGGLPCPNVSFEDQDCNINTCPTNGVWGGWTAWGDCTVECETGSQTRTRACDSPAPLNGGMTCALPGAETQVCNTHMCPIHGLWTQWTAYAACTVTCDLGTKTRTRTCTDPTPQYLGNDCPTTDLDSETVDCDSGVMCGNCHEVYNENPTLGICYKYIEVPQNMAYAREECKKTGGELASFKNAAEVTAAQSEISENTYIGLYDILSEGNFIYTDGGPTSFTPTWASGNPDNAGPTGNQDCVMMQTNGQIQDTDCANIAPYLCKLNMCEPGWTYDVRGDACYFYNTVYHNWYNAEAHCVTLDAHLASINEVSEQDFLTQFAGQSIWFGGSDEGHEGTWIHTDGSAFTFTNWGPGQPDNWFGEHCSEILPNTKWNDIPCSGSKTSICEKKSYSWPHCSNENYFLSGVTKNCYKVDTAAKNWDDASAACVADGGNLVSILNSMEQTFILGLLPATGDNRLWIGLQSNAWSDGSDTSYTKFGSGKPDGSSACTIMDPTVSHDWNDLSCTTAVMSVCKMISEETPALVP